jgi:hypothetical protein
MFEWDPENVPTIKLALHLAQFLLAFSAWAIEIAVFRDPASDIVGDNGWTFAVVSSAQARLCLGRPELTTTFAVLSLRTSMDL